MGKKIRDGRDHSPVPIPGGKACPKCHQPMQRYEHSVAWKPLPGRGYFTHWERCVPCRYLHNIPEAYVKGVRKSELP